jgi:hypothetical protein
LSARTEGIIEYLLKKSLRKIILILDFHFEDDEENESKQI